MDKANLKSSHKDLKLLAYLHSLVGIFASGISGLFGYRSILTIIDGFTQAAQESGFLKVLGGTLSQFLLFLYFLVLAGGVVGLFRIMPDVFKSQGQKTRLFLVLGILGYLVGSGINGIMLGSFGLFMFQPGIRPILMSLCTLWAGYTSLQIQDVLESRELFIKTFSQIPQGDLLQRLQEEHPWILRLQEQIRWLNGFALGLIFSPLWLLLILGVLIPRPFDGLAWPLLSLGMVFCGMILIGLGNTYLDDHRSLAHTVLMPLEQRTVRLFFGGILIFLAITLGSLVPGRTSLIPVQWLSRFFAWLGSIFTPRHQIEIEQEILERFSAPVGPPPPLDPDFALEAFEAAKFLQQLMEILRRALVLGALVGVVFFLFYPLLNTKAFQRWLQELRAGTSKSILGRFIWSFIRLYRFITNSLERLLLPRSLEPSATALLSGEGIDLTSYLEKLKKEKTLKRKPSDKLLKVLEDYFHWGLQKGATLTRSSTLKEFSATIPEPYLHHRDRELEVIGLLDRLLYDGSVTHMQEKALVLEAQKMLRNLIQSALS